MKANQQFQSRVQFGSLVGSIAVLGLGVYAGGAQGVRITRIDVPGAVSLSVSGLNGAGKVAGQCYTAEGAQRAFSWSDGAATDLGTLGGSVAAGNGLNDSGYVVGYSSSVGDTEFHAFLGVGQTLFDLGTLGGAVSSAAAVSDGGHVTGHSQISRTGLDYHAFLSVNGGVMQDLGTLGGSTSWGTGVNSAGQVIGDSDVTDNAGVHAFLHSAGVMRDLGTLGGDYSSAFALNSGGQVTGQSSPAAGSDVHAFLHDGSSMRDLGTLGGAYSSGFALNDAGEVTGETSLADESEIHGFVFRNHTLQDLGTLGGRFSSAWSINNRCQVVGVSSNAAGQQRAFLWHNGVMSDLNSQLPPGSGWELTGAYFINDLGQIVGSGLHQGQPAWFLATPVAGENHPPVASAGPDQTLECTAETVVVTLDGSASSDPDGDTLSLEWFEGAVQVGTGVHPVVALSPGSHLLTLRVTDTAGAVAEDVVQVTVRDVAAPRFDSVTADPAVLWPPNGRMVPVQLTVVATDNWDAHPVSRIVSVKSNEPEKRRGRSVQADWVITGPLTVELRAEKNREHEPRCYFIRVACTDASGNTAHHTVVVKVPRNHGLGSGTGGAGNSCRK